jgi:UDP-N-acetylglucosamine--N-acetylmuramyl-(pentapeptide) pyrophosphoryl-undecaprenol N-acetylglucosamine transferase
VRHYWFVAAGTGGHIFPGLAVARQMARALSPKSTFMFWGDASRLEAKLIPQAGFPIKFLKVEQWKGRSQVKKFLALLGVLCSFFTVLVESFRKKPNALISVGGYVSVPVALVARIRNVPVFLIEPNSVSGVANVLVSKWAVEAYVSPALPDSGALKCPIIKAGNPVREDLKPLVIREQVERIMVLGGSQGARLLAQASVDAALELKALGSNLKWLIQAGDKNLDEIVELVKARNLKATITVVSFIENMAKAYEESDLLISRAGATTLAELAVVGLPSILVPFPHAADDHQRVNAKAFADVGAARMVDERESDFARKLSTNLRDLCASDSGFKKRRDMHLKLTEFARPAASHEISERIMNHLQAKV